MRMTPPPTQNLKALGLWVFFLICYSTFSFLPTDTSCWNDTSCWKNPRGKHREDLIRMRTEPTYMRMTLPPTQNLKALICGSSFLYVAQLSHSYPMWELDSHLNI